MTRIVKGVYNTAICKNFRPGIHSVSTDWKIVLGIRAVL